MLATYSMLERETKIQIQSDFFSAYDATSIAQQLCLNNYTIFKNIHPIEFLHEIWKKNNDASPSFKHFVNRFDMESYWVITELVVNAKNLRERVKILTKFISIGAVFSTNARNV
jgi:RasGEF domain